MKNGKPFLLLFIVMALAQFACNVGAQPPSANLPSANPQSPPSNVGAPTSAPALSSDPKTVVVLISNNV